MTAISKAVVTALINNDDPTKRWYPWPNMLNVENTRPEPEYETFNNNSKQLTQQNIRTVKGLITNAGQLGAASPKMKGKIESSQCGDIGVYYVGVNGSITGKVSPDSECVGCGCGVIMDNSGYQCDLTLASVTQRFIAVPIYDSEGALNYFERADGTKIYPVKLNQATVFANVVPAIDKAVNKLELSFDFDSFEQDQFLVTVPCSEVGGSYLTTITGLIDICGDVSDIAVTGFTIELKSDFGVLLEGITAANFYDANPASLGVPNKIYNKTQDTSITITSVTESSDGVYDVVIPAQTPGDILIIYIFKEGYDTTCVYDNPVVVAAS